MIDIRGKSRRGERVSVRRAVLRTVAVVLGGVLLAGVLGATEAPARADSITSLGQTGFAGVVVDDTRHHVFLALGTGVQVRAFDGSLVTTIPSVKLPTSIALAADDSAVWVAHSSADASAVLSRIDPSTFAVSSHTIQSTCPELLTFAGTRLFAAEDCSFTAPRIYEVDTTGTAPTVGRVLPGPWNTLPRIHGDAAGDRLLAFDGVDTASLVRSYDLTQNPPVAAEITDLSRRCVAAGMSGLPGEAVMLCTAGLADVSLTDLSTGHIYPTVTRVNALAVSDDVVAVGAGGYLPSEYGVGDKSPPDIYVMTRHGDVVVRTIEVDPKGLFEHQLEPGGLALSGDGLTVFSVVRSASGLALHVYADALRANTSMVLSAPASASRASTLVLTGTVTGALPFPAGTTLTVKKVDLAGTHSLPPVTTDTAGGFTVTDVPAVGGANTYTVSFAGSPRHQAVSATAAVDVTRIVPELTLTTDRTVHDYKATAVVRAHLGQTFTGRTVSIYATPVGQSKVLLKTGTVDAAGNLTVTRVVGRKTTFSVVFPGDHRYAPRTVTRAVGVRAALTTTMAGNYGTSGRYKLYRTSVDPTVKASVAPRKDSQCVYFRVQRFAAGAWRPELRSDCIRFNDATTTTSSTTVLVVGTHPRGVNFRIRSEYPGDWKNTATNSAWQYFRFP